MAFWFAISGSISYWAAGALRAGSNSMPLIPGFAPEDWLGRGRRLRSRG